MSPMTPQTPSESGPHHGLNPIRESFSSNVFVSEENEHSDEDDEDDDLEGNVNEDSGLVKDCGKKNGEGGEGVPQENTDEQNESSVVLGNSSSSSSKFRRRKESHV